MKRVAALAAGFMLQANLACAEDGGGWSFGGYVAEETRLFFQSPALDGQSENRLVPSLKAEPELRYRWNGDQDRLTFVPFVRLSPDSYDPERTHGDIRELSWTHYRMDWWLQAGLIKVYWGKTESRHLVDIINQRDAVDNADRDDKLGQPAVVVGKQTGYGTFTGYVLPGFREGTFPGRQGRLRGTVPVDQSQTTYESGAGARHVDVAGRYSHVLGAVDFAVAHFHGTGREPRLGLGSDAAGRLVAVPHYDIIDQTSLELQLTQGAWLWKGEAFRRSGNPSEFYAAVGGVEYTFFGILGRGHDLGLLAEVLYDGRDSDAPPLGTPRQLYLGGRWVMNDIDDTDLLAGVLIDTTTLSRTYMGEFRTRLTERVKLRATAQVFQDIEPSETVFYPVRKDSNAMVGIAYYF